jgi:hypothetical protein
MPDVVIRFSDIPLQSDPRKFKKFYMKVLRNKDLYKEFLEIYDEVVEEGSPIPVKITWIRFRERYKSEDGNWVPK